MLADHFFFEMKSVSQEKKLFTTREKEKNFFFGPTGRDGSAGGDVVVDDGDDGGRDGRRRGAGAGDAAGQRRRRRRRFRRRVARRRLGATDERVGHVDGHFAVRPGVPFGHVDLVEECSFLMTFDSNQSE